MRTLLGIMLLLSLLTALAGGAARVPAKKRVSIDEMKFNPATLEIGVGESVRWTNDDQRDHTVSAADGSFKSGNLRSGDTFEHTFKKAGTYKYTCSYHPRMKGTVDVSDKR
jgi:plastocyanin